MRSKFTWMLTLFITLVLQFSYAQEKTITGVVTDQDGLPLPGANVTVKGTTNGTQTDFDGYYSISTAVGSKLVYSYVGQKTVERIVGATSTINVVLEQDAQALDEVIVTGVGVATSKRQTAISVDAVKAEDLKSAPASDISQALSGKVAGAQIQSTTGQPGQQQNIILRGINSLSSTQPMILVDGIQINTDNIPNGSNSNLSSRLADLDLSDIERVEVIQGAAAGTIYGAQGANGVIQIFTKKGKAGKIKVNYKSNVSLSNILEGNFGKTNLHYYETTSDGYLAANAAGDRLIQNPTTGIWPTPIGNITSDTQVNKPYRESIYNQLDQLVKRDALTYSNSFSVSGGSEKITFYTAISQLEQESVINGKLKRYNFTSNVSANITDKFKVTSSAAIIVSNNTTGGITGSNNVYSGFSNSILIPAYVDNKFLDGMGNYVATPTGDNSVNPFYTYDNRTYNSDLNRYKLNVGFNYKPFNFLELDYKYGIDHYENKFRQLTKNQTLLLTQGIPPFTGTLIERPDTGRTQNSIFSAFVKFNTEDDFNWNFPIESSTQVSYDWRREDFKRITITGTQLPTYSDDINLNQTGQQSVTAFDSSFRTFGFLINQKFDFSRFAGISGGLRVDWSSAFGAGSEAFVFPRGDAYVRLDQVFFNESEIVSEFKIRAAYGEAGIQPRPFDRIPVLNSGQIDNTPVLTIPSVLRNPNLNVQVSKEKEIGTDLRFITRGNWFNNITVNATYYNRTSSDIIRDLDISPSQGATAIKTNGITIDTDGYQIALNTRVYNTENFSWNTIVNFGTYESIISDISNNADIALGNNHVLREGSSVGAFYGFKVLKSLDETRTDGSLYIEEGDVSKYEVGPSGNVVSKETKQAVLTDEKFLIGDPTPDFNMSFIQNITIYKNLRASFQLDWVKGQDVYNQTKQWLYRDLLHEDVAVPITINGETGAWASYYSNLYNTNNPNDYFVEDASFVRLRTASIAYDFSNHLDMFSNLTISLSGSNLLTWTDYSGFDPEAASNFDNPTERGLDQYAFPNFRTYSIGINIGF